MQKLLLSIFFLFTINTITAQSFSLGGGLTLGTQTGVSDEFTKEFIVKNQQKSDETPLLT